MVETTPYWRKLCEETRLLKLSRICELTEGWELLDKIKPVVDIELTEEETLVVFEAARVAMEDDRMVDFLADTLGMEPTEISDIQEKLEAFMQQFMLGRDKC